MRTNRLIAAVSRLVRLLVVAMLLLWTTSLEADQAQYFYDELGRLVAVVDGQGNAAVYNYDAVGNLLSIQRFTTGTTGIAIFMMTPGSARVGTSITIQGFGFTSPSSSNQVAFNGTTATVVSATGTALVTTVPTGATTGPLTVTNANGTATSPQPFTVLVPPIVTGIDPATIPKGVTSQLQLSGFNLATTTEITFAQSGLTASIVAGTVTATTLAVNVTVAGTVPVGSYPFTVKSTLGDVSSGSVQVNVTNPVPGASVGSASIFKPYPPQTPPTGPTSSTQSTSVFKPYPAQTPPSGPTSSAQHTSIFKPYPAQTPPTGPTSSTAAVSVQMP